MVTEQVGETPVLCTQRDRADVEKVVSGGIEEIRHDGLSIYDDSRTKVRAKRM